MGHCRFAKKQKHIVSDPPPRTGQHPRPPRQRANYDPTQDMTPAQAAKYDDIPEDLVPTTPPDSDAEAAPPPVHEKSTTVEPTKDGSQGDIIPAGPTPASRKGGLKRGTYGGRPSEKNKEPAGSSKDPIPPPPEPSPDAPTRPLLQAKKLAKELPE